MKTPRNLIALRLAGMIGAIAVIASLSIAPASATPTPDPTPTIGAFTTHKLDDGVWPNSMIAGSDGNIWFEYDKATPSGSTFTNTSGVARVTSDGVVTYFNLPSGWQISAFPALTLGTDGNLWFVDVDSSTGTQHNVGRITPAGDITEFPLSLPPHAYATNLVQGANGYLWLGSTDQDAQPATGSIWRVSSTGTLTEFPLTNGMEPNSLAKGADGNIWFAEFHSTLGTYNAIGRITDAGAVTDYPLTAVDDLPQTMVTGADGNVWFVAYGNGGDGNITINKVTPSGAITSFLYYSGLQDTYIDLHNGPDGNIWFTEQPLGGSSKLVRVSDSGVFTTMYTPPNNADYYISSLQTGPDGNMWFSSADGIGNNPALVSVSSAGVVNTISTAPAAVEIGSFVFDPSGRIRFTGANSGSSTQYVGSVDLKQVTSSRTSGADRYAVANSISQQAYPSSAPVVYVATGSNYPDALSAGPAAALQGGPLLLTPGDSLPDSVKTEIQRLNPAKIVVVGGVNSVSNTVFTQLAALQPNIIRLAGTDRYDASRTIVSYAFGASGADTVYVATGGNFPDALSAGGAGGAQHSPVLLVNGGATSLDAATSALLTSLNVKHIKIAGGVNSVSSALQTALNNIAPTIRLAGADRFAASQAINENAYTTATRVFLATGFNFPDALAGSAWAATLAAPLYVVPGTCVPQQVVNDIVASGATQITLLGGPNSLTQNVQNLQTCP